MQPQNSLPHTIQPLQLHKKASQQIQTQQATRPWILAKAVVSRLPVVLLLWSTCWLLTGCDVPGSSLTPQPANLIGLANPGNGPNQACHVRLDELSEKSSEKTFEQFFAERGASDIWAWLCYCLHNTVIFGEIDETFLDNDTRTKNMLFNHKSEEKAELQAGIRAYIQRRNQDKLFQKFLEGNGLPQVWQRLNQAKGKDALDLRGMLLCNPEVKIEVLEGIVHFIGKHYPDLANLSLTYNELTTLPESFGQLRKVRELNLSCNKLTTLPKSFGELTKLQTLHLDENQLETLPESFVDLTQLQTLHLSFNQLKALPKLFGKLNQLQTLALYKNSLTELPDTFGSLIKLQTLNLSGNKLTKLPESFGELTKLDDLNLSQNKLTELPDNFGNLTNLIYFQVENNTTIQIPITKMPLCYFLKHYGLNKVWKKLQQAKGEDTLDLRGMLQNRTPALKKQVLERIVQFIGNHCPGLVNLSLSNNQLTKLPDSFASLTKLQKLNLSDNHLKALPKLFENLINLNELNLSNNHLTALPKFFGNLKSLKILYLANNKLKVLPGSLEKLTMLRAFTVENNPLLQLNATLQVTCGNLQLNLFPCDEYVRKYRLKKNLNQDINREIVVITGPDNSKTYIRCTQVYPVILFIKKLGQATLSQPVPLCVYLRGKELVERVYDEEKKAATEEKEKFFLIINK